MFLQKTWFKLLWGPDFQVAILVKFKEPLELMGVPGSPYTRKMLALLRYRRIAYRFIPSSRHTSEGTNDRFRERPQPKVALLPTFYAQDDSGQEVALCDSTPLIREFEKTFPGRDVVPDNQALAFLDYLLEDYADEWLTKAMFHYRWSYEPDIYKAGQILARWTNITSPEEAILEKSKYITEKQISRLRYVGSNETTRDTIEESFIRFIDLLNNHFCQMPFLLGERPSACDFAVYGQLTCLALFDPTPQDIILKQAPRVHAWTEVMEDLSGFETLPNDWISTSSFPETLKNIFKEIGEVYVPYLLANEQSVLNKTNLMETEIGGRPWQQEPFQYQVKCLRWIRDIYDELNEESKKDVKHCLTGSKTERLFG